MMKHNKLPGKPAHGYPVLIALLVFTFLLVGLFSSLMTDQLGLRLDLTENRLYALSNTTHQLLSALKQPVTITVLNTQSDYPRLPRELLRRYADSSEQLTVHYCDPYANPALIHSYEARGYTLSIDDLIVESGERCRQVSLEDLYVTDASKTSIKSLIAEQAITSAIVTVVGTDKSTVQFTDGHDEQSSQSLQDLFSRNGFAVSYTTLSVLGIDDDTQLLVIAAPKRDFSPEDITLVETFLEAGGSVMAFLDPGTALLPNLSTLLEDWGIGLSNHVVQEPQLYVSGNSLNIAATYASHPITSYFSGNRYYVITPSCQALEQRFQKQGSTLTQPVLFSSSKATASRDSVDALDTASQIPGPFVLSMTSQRESTTAAGTQTGRLFVCGSMKLYGDDLMNTENLANHDFLVQVAKWCTDDETLLNISGKNMNAPYLPILSRDSSILSAVLVVGLPLLILVFGFVEYIRRRHL